MISDSRKPKNDEKGFTLLEMLIVLIIVLMLAFLGTNLVMGSFKSKARELSWRMASTIRYLYNLAVTENKTVRLAFDFESNSYWAEGTAGKFLLEKGAGKNSDNVKKEEPEAEEAESAYLKPLEPTFGSIETPLLATRELPPGIYLKDVYTSHDDGPITEGRAYVYFFTNGSTEDSVINFRDEYDERHISIRINPLNGGVSIEPLYRTLETNK